MYSTKINQLDSEGLRHGFWRVMHRNPPLKIWIPNTLYKKGKYVENKNKDNCIWYEANYFHGRTVGSSKLWNKYGTLKIIRYYNDGVEEGELVRFIHH